MLLSFGTEHERTPPKLSLARGSNELHLAVTAGFEPAVACTTHAFQACSFGRSDTSPRNNLSILSDAGRATGQTADNRASGTPGCEILRVTCRLYSLM